MLFCFVVMNLHFISVLMLIDTRQNTGHWIRHFQPDLSIQVYAAILSKRLIGPSIFDNALTSAAYLDMPKAFLISSIK